MSTSQRDDERPLAVYSIQLSPATDGCGWIRIRPNYEPPTCPLPVAYTLTGTFDPSMTGRACVEHAALMREVYPEWVASIASARTA